MRLAFITDPHLDAEGVTPDGVDVRRNFLDALAFVQTLNPDGLVIGGDFCYGTSHRAVYEWAKEQLDRLRCPYYVIAGNHDNSVELAGVFRLSHHLHGPELYYALPLEGRPALFLDSAKGQLSAEQWEWLRDYFAALRDNNVLVFMHHPPVPADMLFMDDRYPFRQSDQFVQLVRDLPCHVAVVCGHYHVSRSVQRGNLLVLLSPSTFYQLNPDSERFAIDHYRIGIRELNLTTHGLSSTVHWIEPKPLSNHE